MNTAPFGEFGPYVVAWHCESNSVTSPDCTATSTKPGLWFQPLKPPLGYGDEPGEVRNMSTAPATVYATQVAPDADPAVFRIEDDPPPCA